MKNNKIAILPKLFDYHGDMSKKWYVYFSVRDPRSGKMVVIKIYKGLFKEKNKQKRYELANKIIEQYTEKIKAGYDFINDESTALYDNSLQYQQSVRVYQERRKSNRTFNFYASRYLQERVGGLEKSTVDTYRSILRITSQWLIREKLDDADITAIDNALLMKFFRWLDQDQQISAVTYKRYKNKLHQFFEFLMDEQVVRINPVYRVPDISRQVDCKPLPIHPDQWQKVIDELQNDPETYLFISFMYYCFMRPGKEILQMKIGWIDWGNAVIRVPKNISKTDREKKPIIPDEFLKLLLDDYKLHTYPADFFVFGRDGRPGEKHRGKNTFGYRWRKLMQMLNMPKNYKLYSPKHTGNSALKRSGASMFDRMMQNGHTSIKTTEVYDRDTFGFESEHIRKNFPVMDKKRPEQQPRPQNIQHPETT